MMIKRLVSILLALFITAACASAATLLPPGEQVFLDNNGQPLSGGQVYFYIPNTNTPKSTYQNSAQTVSNTNPVILDSSGRAIIYGSGQYREKVLDANGNLIWDQSTADTSATTYSWANISSGSANSQTVTASNFTSTDGQQIGFIAGLSNTSAFTLIVNGGTPLNAVKPTATGPTNLTNGDIVAGNQYLVTYSASNGNFQLSSVTSEPILTSTPIASAATVDLGTILSHNASITGSVGIASFGSSASTASQFYFVSFAGSPLITVSTSLLTPTGVNLQAQSGGSALAAYLGSGVWQIISYSAPAVNTPSVTVYTTGSGTYTTPANATYIEVVCVGGGSGGGGSGTGSPGVGVAGGNTTFGPITAEGGPQTPSNATFAYPTPAVASGGYLNVPGALGGGAGTLNTGAGTAGFTPSGASSPYGGGGPGTSAGGIVAAGAATGYGAGGGAGGYGVNAGYNSGWGGNSGAFSEALIAAPAATYSYSVGAGGAGGAAGTSGATGAKGAGGLIIITAHFN